MPTVAQRPVGGTGNLAHLLGILAQYSDLKQCFLLVTVYVRLPREDLSLPHQLSSGILAAVKIALNSLSKDSNKRAVYRC